MFKPAGKWWNGNQELIKKDGSIYALHGWNGESYAESWKVENDLDAVGSYDIRPVFNQIAEDQFEIVDYEVKEN